MRALLDKYVEDYFDGIPTVSGKIIILCCYHYNDSKFLRLKNSKSLKKVLKNSE